MFASAASRCRSPTAAQSSSASSVSSRARSSSPSARSASARLLSAAARADGSSSSLASARLCSSWKRASAWSPRPEARMPRMLCAWARARAVAGRVGELQRPLGERLRLVVPRRRCAVRLRSARRRASSAVASSGSAASASANELSASSHSPRRWWTRPVRCSIEARRSGGGERGRRLVALERAPSSRRRASAGRRSPRAASPDRRDRARAPRGSAASASAFAYRSRACSPATAERTRRPRSRARPRGDAGRSPRRGAAPVARGERVGRPAVEEAAPAGARELVRDPPRLLVPEGVARRVALDEEPAARQLLERGHGLLVVAAAHLADEVRVERAAEHGGGGEHLPGDLARCGDPGLDQPAHAGRQRLVAVCIRPRVEVLARRRTARPRSPRTACAASSARAPAAAASSATASRSSRSSGIDDTQPLARRVGEDAPRRMSRRASPPSAR